MKKVAVLGTGCAKCNLLAERVQAVAKECGIAYEFEKVSDITEIMKYGVMMTPALAIDGKVVFSGKVPKDEDIKKALSA